MTWPMACSYPRDHAFGRVCSLLGRTPQSPELHVSTVPFATAHISGDIVRLILKQNRYGAGVVPSVTRSCSGTFLPSAIPMYLASLVVTARSGLTPGML